MKTLLKILPAFLLSFNGIGALYGSYHLIVYPDGSSLQMSTDYLEHSPFDNYLIPGIILFVMNGACSFVVLAALLIKHRRSALLIAGQGAILTGWIGIQIAMVQMVYFLHYVMGSAGILLLLSGYMLWRVDKKEQQ